MGLYEPIACYTWTAAGRGAETLVTNSNVLAAARLLRRGGPTYEQEVGIETAPRQHA